MASKYYGYFCRDCNFNGDLVDFFDNGGLCPQCNSQNIEGSYKTVSTKRKDVVEAFQCPSTVEIPADSSICHYCQRKQFYDKAFDDGMCEDCTGYSNFIGVDCKAMKCE